MYLPVPSFSTARTRDSTSVTEKGRLVRRCPISERLDLWCTGTTARASMLASGTGTKALELDTILLVSSVAGDGIKSLIIPGYFLESVIGGFSSELVTNLLLSELT